jgi:hypothetical protein
MQLYSIKYREIIFTTLVLFAAFALRAQTGSDQLYGFSQVTIPGAAAAKRVTDDAGNVVERRTEDLKMNYFIYLRTAVKTRVYPVEVWIKGKAFSARPEIISNTPVQVSGPVVMGRTQKTTLVPKTTQKVIQLVPIPLTSNKSTQKAQNLAAANELVVVYKQGGKTYYKTLKAITELSPQALQ